jgi:hypothetical protein
LKRRGALGSVQNAEPSAGAGSDVKQTPARAQQLHDPIHCLSNMRNLSGYRRSYLLIV